MDDSLDKYGNPAEYGGQSEADGGCGISYRIVLGARVT